MCAISISTVLLFARCFSLKGISLKGNSLKGFSLGPNLGSGGDGRNLASSDARIELEVPTLKIL